MSQDTEFFRPTGICVLAHLSTSSPPEQAADVGMGVGEQTVPVLGFLVGDWVEA